MGFWRGVGVRIGNKAIWKSRVDVLLHWIRWRVAFAFLSGRMKL